MELFVVKVGIAPLGPASSSLFKSVYRSRIRFRLPPYTTSTWLVYLDTRPANRTTQICLRSIQEWGALHAAGVEILMSGRVWQTGGGVASLMA